MPYTVPRFQPEETGTRTFDWIYNLERFLLDAWLGSNNALLRFSSWVEHALSMLGKTKDKVDFLDISTILAFAEMQRWVTQKGYPVGWDDIARLKQLKKELA